MKSVMSIVCIVLLVTVQGAAQSTASSTYLEDSRAYFQQGQDGSTDPDVDLPDPNTEEGAKVWAWVFAILGGYMAFGPEEHLEGTFSNKERRIIGSLMMGGFGTLAVLGDRQRSVPIPGTGLGIRPTNRGAALTKDIGW